MRVLIVEDDRDSAESLGELLRFLLSSTEVELAFDGAQGLAAVTAAVAHFDVVISDIEMPRMDGLTAASRIRDAMGAQVPVLIAMTGNAGIPGQPATQGMFDHVFLKPVALDDLVTLLKSLPTRSGF